jgi:hypothetical protein
MKIPLLGEIPTCAEMTITFIVYLFISFIL